MPELIKDAESIVNEDVNKFLNESVRTEAEFLVLLKDRLTRWTDNWDNLCTLVDIPEDPTPIDDGRTDVSMLTTEDVRAMVDLVTQLKTITETEGSTVADISAALNTEGAIAITTKVIVRPIKVITSL